MRLVEALFDRSRATLSAFLLLLAAGGVALEEIPKEAEPDIEIPLIHVNITQAGLSAEDADRRLVTPIVNELRNLEGVEHIRSSAYAGGATVSLEFDEDFDFVADDVTVRVRERLEIVRDDLPDDAGQPRVSEVNLSLFPLLVVTVSGDVPEATLLGHARELRDELLRLPTVLGARIAGEREERLEVIVDPLVLTTYGLDINALLGQMSRSNRLVPAGGVDTERGRLEVALTGRFQSIGDVLDMPVKADSGAVVRLGDIATLRTTLGDRTSLARLNGQPAVAIAVTKPIGVNVFESLEDIRETVSATASDWPQTLSYDYSQDSSWRIRARIGELRNSLVMAVVLVMAVLIATLGVRSGLLVGIAIPGSFLVAILILALADVAINTAVLYAFVMSVGLLVDGAIVMVENADRLMREGVAPREAYARSVRHMSTPIATSTVTTLIVFVPLVFWPGVIGEYMKYLPLTVLLTLTASLIISVVFVPVLGAALATASAGDEAADPEELSAPARAYRAFLAIILRRPVWALLAGVGVLVWSMWLYERYGLETEFLPVIEPTRAVVLVRAPGDRALAEKHALALEVERVVRSYDAFESVFMQIGRQPGAHLPGAATDGVIASALIEFRNWHEHAGAEDVLSHLEERLERLRGLDIEVQRIRSGPLGAKPIDIDVTAGSPIALAEATAKVRQYADTHPKLRRADDSRPAAGIEWRLAVDRVEAARFGVDVASVGQHVRFVTRGLKLGTIDAEDAGSGASLADDGEVDIVMRYQERYRTVSGLDAIRIQTRGGPVPLSLFATLEPAARGGKVERLDGQLTRRVRADIVLGAPQNDVARDVNAWLRGTRLPAGAEARVRGDDEDREEARSFLFRAFAAALFAMALVLVAQFNSFYSAFLILFAVVLSTVGVRIGLLIMQMPFGVIMSGIGVIALAGIVVNNNIILIDSYNRLKREGMAAREALLRTGETRLRPVLLTSVTTIAGLAPLVTRVDIDFVERTVAIGAPATAYWVQMSSAIVFGLTFATLMTLLVTPAALMLRELIDEARAQEHADPNSQSIAAIFKRDGTVVGLAAITAIGSAWFLIPESISVRLLDIFGKQIFEQVPSSWFQALESASFYSLVMCGAAYAYWRNTHVRVDLIRERLSARLKAWIEIVGFFVLLLPVCIVILIAGWEYVVSSFAAEERSGALLGSPTNWIFKGMIVMCFAQLLALGVHVTWRNVRFLRGLEAAPSPPESERPGQDEAATTAR